MSRAPEQICRIRFVPKNADSFRIKARDLGTVSYVTSERFVIGGAAEADVNFSGTGIADRHLQVEIKGQEITIEDLGSAKGTIVSGRAITAKTNFPYRSGEVIQLGESEHLLTIELFGRMWNPDDEARTIVKRAQEQVEELEKRKLNLHNEVQHALEQSQNERGKIESQARLEAERIVSEAHRQVEEKIRQAIDEGRSRAQVSADELIMSAKSQVEHILAEARGKADEIAREGMERNEAAKISVECLSAELQQLSAEKQRLESETLNSKSAFDEAFRRKETLLKQIEEIDNEYNQAQLRFQTLFVEMEKVEKASQKQLETLKVQCKDVETQMLESKRQQVEAEKRKSEVIEEIKQVGVRTAEMYAKRDAAVKETNEAIEIKKKKIEEIKQLEVQYHNELGLLRQKVDTEYVRQLKEQEAYFKDLRERETHENARLQERIDEIEQARIGHQTELVNDRIWNLLTDRGVLYGIGSLRNNTEFKADVHRIISRTFNEELEFRRREVVSARAWAKKSRSHERSNGQTLRYAGWMACAAFVGLHFFMDFQGRARKLEQGMTISASCGEVGGRPCARPVSINQAPGRGAAAVPNTAPSINQNLVPQGVRGQ